MLPPLNTIFFLLEEKGRRDRKPVTGCLGPMGLGDVSVDDGRDIEACHVSNKKIRVLPYVFSRLA
jgi:hypothetical protein